MRHSITMVFAGLAFTTAAPAFAAEGDYASALRTMLTQTAAGTCPAELMGQDLLNACKDQLPNLQAGLAAAGPIKSMTFVKADTMQDNRIETYKVTFAKGHAQTWHIGIFKDGKFQSAYTNGG